MRCRGGRDRDADGVRPREYPPAWPLIQMLGTMPVTCGCPLLLFVFLNKSEMLANRDMKQTKLQRSY